MIFGIILYIGIYEFKLKYMIVLIIISSCVKSKVSNGQFTSNFLGTSLYDKATLIVCVAGKKTA